MRLVYEATGDEVRTGDTVSLGDDELATVTGIEKPRHGGSTGRIYVKPLHADWTQGYYPSVFNAKWIEREDQL